VRKLRKGAKENFGNWDKMLELLRQYPYLMRNEIKYIESLKENNGKYLLGFKDILDQTKLFVYSYGSYYFNKLLSKLISSNENIPEELPLLSSHQDDIDFYKTVIPQEEIDNLKLGEEFLHFLRIDKKRGVPTKIMPRIGKIIEIDAGYIICFALHKGGYATTMLSEIFDLYHGFPVPDWVMEGEVDSKKYVNEGSLQDLLDKLEQFKGNSQNIELEEDI